MFSTFLYQVNFREMTTGMLEMKLLDTKTENASMKEALEECKYQLKELNMGKL